MTLMEKFEFDPNYMVRGLIVDKRRGNILKMDRHNYVKVAYHGFTALDTEERWRRIARRVSDKVLMDRV